MATKKITKAIWLKPLLLCPRIAEAYYQNQVLYK